MNVLDLFSGIGGFSLGLERTGMKTIGFCEIDEDCQKILQKHWPDVPIYTNIKELDGNRFKGKVDLITGGYPCQPFSISGKRKGNLDERHLWPEMLRVIKECRPSWVISENVRGHLSLGFESVAMSLEAEGFKVWPFTIPACAFAAPHERERLWIVAYSDRNNKWSNASRYGIQEESEILQQTNRETRTDNSKPLCGNESSERIGTSGILANINSSFSSGLSSRKEKTFSEFRINGKDERVYRNNWQVEPTILRVVNGLSRGLDKLRRNRIKMLGNSVLPQIPEMIGLAILKFMDKV